MAGIEIQNSPDGHKIAGSAETLHVIGNAAAHLPDVAQSNLLAITKQDLGLTGDDAFNIKKISKSLTKFFDENGFSQPSDYSRNEIAKMMTTGFAASQSIVAKDGQNYSIMIAPDLNIKSDYTEELSENDGFRMKDNPDTHSQLVMTLSHEAGHIWNFTHPELAKGRDSLAKESIADLRGAEGYKMMLARGVPDLDPALPEKTQAMRDIAGLNFSGSADKLAALSTVSNADQYNKSYDHDTGGYVAKGSYQITNTNQYLDMDNDVTATLHAAIGAAYSGQYKKMLESPGLTADDKERFKLSPSKMVSEYRPTDANMEDVMVQGADNTLISINNLKGGVAIAQAYPEIQYGFAKALYDNGGFDGSKDMKDHVGRYLSAFETQGRKDLVLEGQELAENLNTQIREDEIAAQKKQENTLSTSPKPVPAPAMNTAQP